MAHTVKWSTVFWAMMAFFAFAAVGNAANIIISDSTTYLTSDANGGDAIGTGDATGHSVTMVTGGQVEDPSNINGGRSIAGGSASMSTGAAHHNSVTISGGRVVGTVPAPNSSTGGMVRGGDAGFVGDAYSNTVLITGGIIDYGVNGGDAYDGDAYDNEVVIDADAVIGNNVDDHANVYGGYSKGGDASSNTVYIRGGIVNGDVSGGNAYDPAVGNAEYNNVWGCTR